MRTCKVCGDKHYAHGFCEKHYKIAKKRGEIVVTRKMGLSIADRLQKYSRLDSETGCVEWIGTRNPDGYGVLNAQSKTWSAHRAAWTEVNGEIPDGLQVLHKCDNRPCINPNHLFLGTQVDNIMDMCTKGRQAKAETAGGAKFTPREVRAIREDRRTNKEIAGDYGVNPSMISRIKRGKTYRYVSDLSLLDRDRRMRGTSHHRAKLNEDAIRAIRSDIRTHAAVAADYGVCHSLISSIRKRKSWRHVQ